MMNLTPAQQRAIDTHDKNLVVVAGAGSGKTRVLVERYLALLDAHPDWPLNAVVAVTFTRKAAQEMRDRVRGELENRLSRAGDDDTARIWSDRLASMDSARIDTIHGLCTTILRANAAEAGLDPDFGVMDEVDADILLDTVIDDELARLAEDDDPALALFAQVDRPAIAVVLRAFKDKPLPAPPDDWLAHWQSVWDSFAADCLARLRQDAAFRAAINWQPKTGWPEPDTLTAKREACSPYLDLLVNDQTSLARCMEALSAIGDVIKGNFGAPSKWGGKEGLAEAKACMYCIRDKAKAALAEIGAPPGDLDRRAAEMLPLWVRLIGRVQQAYAAAKQQQSLLDFNDLERITCDLLTSRESVRARYQQAEFQHLLVDEFQDTNRAQWEIVRALADPQQPGSLFIVGDQKQSIYAFRGADVSVFSMVRRQLTALGGAEAEIALARSFRTHQPLVDGFNAIFERILVRDSGSPAADYETELDTRMDAHRQHPPGAHPPLEFLLLDATDAEMRADERRRQEAYEIARRLQAMVAEEALVYDRDTNETRPVRFGDIALLFQSTSNITLYEDVFKALDLPFITLAGRGYYSRQEVWDLLNLLRALYRPADNLALASALRSPLFGLSDDALLALRLVQDAEGRRVLLWDALNQPEVVPADEVELTAFARDCLYELAALAGRVTISELLREALDRTGFLATLTGLPDGARRRGNVEKLLVKAESSGRITLGAFEQYLSDLSAREVREGEAQMEAHNQVALMTVHASKGLEFPVVVLVDASWQGGQDDRGGPALLLDPLYGLCCKAYSSDSEKLEATAVYRLAGHVRRLRDEAERRRLLYVAATRAQDYLLVSGQVQQNKAGWKCEGWLDWLLDALDLKDHLDAPGEQTIERGWGQVRLTVCDILTDDALMDDRRASTAWDRLYAGHVPLAEAVHLPLLDSVAVDRSAAARHLSVTQLADLGANEIDSYYSDRFRRAVLHDAPGHVSPVPYTRSFRRLVGEMVHEALRWWQPGADMARLDTLLASYAWEQGIVDAGEKDKAVRAARELLDRYFQSDLYHKIARASPVYYEVPFVYQHGARIIHGVIDALFQSSADRWAIVDYKTSSLRAENQTEANWHARRYHMQVGAYAAAVVEQLKLDAAQLDVYIHYVRYDLTVPVTSGEWRGALDKLEAYIHRVVGT
jgi:ATP-dependent helicase/nuclease subunit A